MVEGSSKQKTVKERERNKNRKIKRKKEEGVWKARGTNKLSNEENRKEKEQRIITSSLSNSK
jgi:hypothetical protein